MRPARWESKLLADAELPFLPERLCNLGVTDKMPRIGLGTTLLNRLDNVEMIEHIVQTAIVRQTIEQLPHGFLCSHGKTSRDELIARHH